MFHLWFVPVAVAAALVMLAFYLIIRFRGGSGVRTEGRTVVDKPTAEEDLPPG